MGDSEGWERRAPDFGRQRTWGGLGDWSGHTSRGELDVGPGGLSLSRQAQGGAGRAAGGCAERLPGPPERIPIVHGLRG